MKRTVFPSRFAIGLSLVPVMVLLLPATQAAVVYTTVLSGDPSQPDTDVEFGVGVRDNAAGIVGSYAFLLRWPAETLVFGSVTDVSFGVPPDARFVAGQLLVTRFLSNSRFDRGLLCTITMRTAVAVSTGSYSVTLEPYGAAPLTTLTPYERIPFITDDSETRGLGAGPPLPRPTAFAPTEYEDDIDGDGIPSPPERRDAVVGRSNSLLTDSDGDGLADANEDANGNGRHDTGETNARGADSDGDGWEDGVELLVLATDPLDANDPGPLADGDGDGLPATVDPDDTKPDTDGDRFLDGYEAAVVGLSAVTDETRKPALADVNLDGFNSGGSMDTLIIAALFRDTLRPDNEVFNGSGFVNSDLDRDGRISSGDVLLAAQFFVRELPTLPVRWRYFPDFDWDGLPDAMESAGVVAASGEANLVLPDSDGDGLADGYEDRNRNGVVDAGESDPRNPDSDGDGVLDGLEERYLGTGAVSPGNPAEVVDADGDELPLPLDPDDTNPDTDGDRYADGYEAAVASWAAVEDAGDHPPLGDANADGHVSNVDALLLQAVFLDRWQPADADGIYWGDINRDGSISNADAHAAHAYFLGLLERLPVGP